MAPGLTSFKYSKRGYIELMQSTGVQADLARRSQDVKAVIAAQYRNRSAHWDLVANVRVGRTRAVAIISGVPLREEFARRILGSAMDAAR